MAKIISGYADNGGSPARKATTVERAKEDLQAKLKGAEVQALTTYTDDGGLHLIAACEGAPAGKSKRGGK